MQLKNQTLKAKIKKERDVSGSRDRHNSSSSHKLKTFDLRNKLISKVKSVSEQELERQKSRLKKYKSGIVLDRGSKERSPSVNSISSDDSVLSDKPSTKKKRKKTNETDASVDEEAIGKLQIYLLISNANQIFNFYFRRKACSDDAWNGCISSVSS